MFVESAAQSSGLPGSQIQGLVLLTLVKLPQVLLLCLVDYSQDSGDGLADDANLGELGSGSSGHFSYTELGQFIFQVVQLLEQLLLFLAPQISSLDLGLVDKPLTSLVSTTITGCIYNATPRHFPKRLC